MSSLARQRWCLRQLHWPYVCPLTYMQLAASDVLGIAVELSLELPCRTSGQFY